VSVVDGNKFRADLTGESYAAIAGRDVPAPVQGAEFTRGTAADIPVNDQLGGTINAPFRDEFGGK
jgi:hypothetical protein